MLLIEINAFCWPKIWLGWSGFGSGLNKTYFNRRSDQDWNTNLAGTFYLLKGISIGLVDLIDDRSTKSYDFFFIFECEEVRLLVFFNEWFCCVKRQNVLGYTVIRLNRSLFSLELLTQYSRMLSCYAHRSVYWIELKRFFVRKRDKVSSWTW